MAEVHIHETFAMRLTSAEFALVVKGLGKLKTGEGEPLGPAMELRDTLLRHRAQESIQRAEKAQEVLSGLDDS